MAKALRQVDRARLAQEAERLFAPRLAALFTRAANGATPAVLDLAVLHQLDAT